MRLALPPCPKCRGQLQVEYPSDGFVIRHIKPEAVCLQCGWRRGVLLQEANAAPQPALRLVR